MQSYGFRADHERPFYNRSCRAGDDGCPVILRPTPRRIAASRVNLTGTLELIDKPPEPTPVEALEVVIHSVQGADQFRAQPNRDGAFTLENVHPGRYFLNLGFPGRLRFFGNGSRILRPDDFELMPGESGPLRIVVSWTLVDLSVDVTGIPDNQRNVVAVLSPADPYLTLRTSSFLYPVSGHHTQFRSISPGSYMIFIVDSEFQRVVASSAAVREALKHQAAAVQVRDEGETNSSAIYLTPDVVRKAITQAELDK
jgi:hypothetical protein